MVSKLDKHEWDEDCSFCMANPWLQETKDVADLLPKLIDEEQQILFDIESIGSDINDIQKQIPNEKLQRLSEIKHSLGISNGEIIAQEHELVTLDWNIETVNNNIKNEKSRLKKSEKQKDNIIYNKTKNSEIQEIRDEISTVNSELTQLDSKLLVLSGKLKMAEKSKKDALDGIDRLKELEQQYQGYEYYQKAVQRNGVPYHLITKALQK